MLLTGGVLWRKRSQGSRNEKGNHWVERILVLRHTCRIRGRPTFPLLVDAVSYLFKGGKPNLSWLTQHESLQCPLPRDQIPFSSNPDHRSRTVCIW
jgi:hypothetical protein